MIAVRLYHNVLSNIQGPMGPPGPPGEAQPYPSELMGAGKPLLVSGRRKRSLPDHAPILDLPDLEADFETVVFDISENRLTLKEGVHMFVDKMWNHIVKVGLYHTFRLICSIKIIVITSVISTVENVHRISKF